MSEKLLLSRKEGQQITGLGLSKFDELLRRENDPVPHIRVGRRVLIPADALRVWIDRQVENGQSVC